MTVALANLPQNANVQGFWKLEETSGARNDESSNAYHLTDNGTVKIGSGKDGNCAFFDGTAMYLNRDNPSALNPSGSFSISFWFRTSNTGVLLAVGKDTGSSPNRQYDCALANRLRFYCSANGSTMPSRNGTTTAIADGTMHMGTFVYTFIGAANSMIEFYLDGQPDGSDSTLPGPIASGTGAFIISGNPGGNYWDGKIDEVVFWNVALTAQEVLDLYNAYGTGSTEDALVFSGVDVWDPGAEDVRSNNLHRDDNGNWWFAAKDTDETNVVKICKSEDDGQTWQTSSISTADRVSLIVRGEKAYVLYRNSTTGAIYFRRYTDYDTYETEVQISSQNHSGNSQSIVAKPGELAAVSSIGGDTLGYIKPRPGEMKLTNSIIALPDIPVIWFLARIMWRI